MNTQIYYHGTKEKNIKSIIESRKLCQKTKEYSQSEEGFVYICSEQDFAQTIAYAIDYQAYSYTFIRFEIVVDSELGRNLQKEVKTSDFGTLISLKYKGDIDFSSEYIQNPKYITLKKGSKEYLDFNNFIVTSYPPEYDKAKDFLDNLTWHSI